MMWAMVPNGDGAGLLGPPSGIEAFEEFQHARPAEDVQIITRIFGRERRVAVFQKRNGPKIDGLSANNGRADDHFRQ